MQKLTCKHAIKENTLKYKKIPFHSLVAGSQHRNIQNITTLHINQGVLYLIWIYNYYFFYIHQHVDGTCLMYQLWKMHSFMINDLFIIIWQL